MAKSKRKQDRSRLDFSFADTSFERIVLTLMYVVPIFTVFGGIIQLAASALESFLILMLVRRRSIVFAIPALVFFYQYLLVGSLSVFRIFSVVYLFSVIIRGAVLSKTHIKRIGPALLVIILYSLVVIGPADLTRAVLLCFDFIVLAMAAAEIREDGSFGRFLTFTSFAAVAASLFGFFTSSNQSMGEVINGEYVYVARHLACFNDVNYAGMFLNIGIVSTVCSSVIQKKPIVKYAFLALIYVALFRTASTTAVICNGVLIALYFFYRKRNRAGTALLATALFAAGMYFALAFGLSHPEFSDFHSFCLRISSKISALRVGDFGLATTGRSSLSLEHVNYFFNQENLLCVLFGGNASSAVYLDGTTFSMVAHNEFVDLLLNVGMVGFVVVVGTLFSRAFRLAKIARSGLDEVAIADFLIKVCFIAYAFTLTMFMDIRLYLFFLI